MTKWPGDSRRTPFDERAALRARLVANCHNSAGGCRRDVDGPAGLHVGHRVIDVVEIVELHEPLKREAAVLVKRDELGDEELLDRVSLDNAPDGPAVQQRSHVELGACSWRDPGDQRNGPGYRQGIERDA